MRMSVQRSSEWSEDPLLGRGYGTRVIGAPGPDGQILDDQWLVTLLETGIAGAVGWLWLFVSCVTRFGRGARVEPRIVAGMVTDCIDGFCPQPSPSGCSSTMRSRSSK